MIVIKMKLYTKNLSHKKLKAEFSSNQEQTKHQSTQKKSPNGIQREIEPNPFTR
jgi:hypothetical protein